MGSNTHVVDEAEDNSIIASFEEMAGNAEQVQEALLQQILESNASCEYLYHTCGLHGRTDTPSFKKCVPLITHSNILPYIERILDGDPTPTLTAMPIRAMSRSSGTSSGQTKFVPFVDSVVPIWVYAKKLSNALRNRLYPLTCNSRIVNFRSARKLGVSKGGLKVGPASAYVNVITKHLYQSSSNLDVEKICNSLNDVAELVDFRQTIYCQLLCGLMYHEEVECISAGFAYALAEAFGTLKTEWEQLCEDIRLGRLSKKITDLNLSADVLETVLNIPRPDLAQALKEKFRQVSAESQNWCGIIPLIWPKCKYVRCILTGHMEPYVDRLKWYAGSVPLVCGDYGSSEGPVAVNINPESKPPHVLFTVVPNLAYYEFIPYCKKSKDAQSFASTMSSDNNPDIRDAGDAGQPLNVSQVQVGEE